MRRENEIGEPLGRNGGQGGRRQRLRVRGVMGVEPRALEARHIGKPRHVLRVFVASDEGGKVAAILKQQQRIRRRLPNVKARHRPEELFARDAPHRRKDGRERVDQAHRHVIAIDVVALDGAFALGACNQWGISPPGRSNALENMAA